MTEEEVLSAPHSMQFDYTRSTGTDLACRARDDERCGRPLEWMQRELLLVVSSTDRSFDRCG